MAAAAVAAAAAAYAAVAAAYAAVAAAYAAAAIIVSGAAAYVPYRIWLPYESHSSSRGTPCRGIWLP